MISGTDETTSLKIIWHLVVLLGDINFPSQIYFFERCLTGTYVKYSSNTNFNVLADQPGIEPTILKLMKTFMHWT
jgi:hypothetical protein